MSADKDALQDRLHAAGELVETLKDELMVVVGLVGRLAAIVSQLSDITPDGDERRALVDRARHEIAEWRNR